MLDVRKSRELQATILALRQAQRDLRLQINKDARNEIRPLWKRAVGARAHTRLERAVILPGARANASDRGVKFYAATKGRPLRGELVPSYHWPAVEFGARTRVIEVTQRSRSGRRYRRNLTINKQFKGRQSEGMIAFDAASEVGTRLVGIWVRTVVDRLANIPAAEVV